MTTENGNETPNGETPTPETGDPGTEGGEARTFTQADLDKIVARRVAETKRAEAQRLEQELGIKPSEARAIIAAKQKADADAMSEAERDRAEAKAAKDEADAERAAAKQERFAARLERKLTAAGVPEAALRRAVRLVDIDPDADDDTITAEIDTLRDEVPGLFDTPTAPPAPRSPSGVTPARPPAGGQGSRSALDKGAELYKSTRKTESAA
jgi:hypothetical protein